MTDRLKMLPILVLALFTAVLGACGSDDDPTGPDDDTPTAPAQPSGVAVAEVDGAARVTWNPVDGADSYEVERDVVGAGSGFVGVASGLADTEFLDEEVEEGQSLLYRVIAVNSVGRSTPSDPVDLVLGIARSFLRGNVTGVRTLSADTTYVIQGIVAVLDGGELRIPAGTLLLGDIETAPTAVVVRQGGKIFSDGSAEAPVVFTSAAPVGQRRRGDWGGVILNGRSLCNFPAGECIGEGNSGPYGGNITDDDSGRIVYTRIEYAGFEVSFGSELNALTLNGVGSGTEIHHVQTHYGLDDGFEWFGGTVDGKYLIATGISDDSFDYSTGWQGRGQFWLAQQDPQDADNGYEVDGNEDNFDATPFTQPTIYNVTLVGKGPNGQGGAAGESTRGMIQRRGTAGFLYNHVVIGFGTSGIDIDNQETANRLDAGEFFVRNSIIFSNASNFDTDDDGIDEQALIMRPEWENRVVDPGLVDPFNRTAPDFRPAAGSQALTGFATPPNDGFFDAVDFVGGVSPEGSPWYEGWITLDQG